MTTFDVLGEEKLTPIYESVRDSLGFYPTSQAARIAQVPEGLLARWRKQDIVKATLQVVHPDIRDQLGYTFEALVYLRLLRMLRTQGVSLSKSVFAVYSLVNRFGSPGSNWAKGRLVIDHGSVYARERGALEVTEGVQFVMPKILFEKEFQLLEKRLDALLVPVKYSKYVQIDPEAFNGMPFIVGTGIRTELIRRLVRAGKDVPTILSFYPHLTAQQIRAANNYEAGLDLQSSKAA